MSPRSGGASAGHRAGAGLTAGEPAGITTAGPEEAFTSHFRVLGTAFTVRTHGAVAQEIDRLLAPFRETQDATGALGYSVISDGDARSGGHTVHGDAGALAGGLSRRQAVATLLAEINARAVEGFTGFAVHAGVVATGGRVVAFPASSGAGKSTLTAACLAAGFDYVSDEALCVDFDTARVVPYLKPLALSAWSRRAVGLAGEVARAGPAGGEVPDRDEMPVLASQLGARAAGGPLELAHVVELERAPGPPLLQELPRSHTMARLLGLSFNHYKSPRRSFELVAELARAARAWRLTHDDPASAARVLLERLATGTRPR